MHLEARWGRESVAWVSFLLPLTTTSRSGTGAETGRPTEAAGTAKDDATGVERGREEEEASVAKGFAVVAVLGTVTVGVTVLVEGAALPWLVVDNEGDVNISSNFVPPSISPFGSCGKKRRVSKRSENSDKFKCFHV